ncbi:hypothetical protein [Burkholderia lata]|uniref:Uncharacterized protein n=1 Tax=Burkholderia lata (strain ATCC 17760 / DSM 23089 / LMG 22485 / NCIMB 9086 / R18194 / 383) TaxID=482957 RepID=A0A6P2VDD8_BURL3|nr:hypothetical protein [Burkholderia lata]VWC79657.1 hypothetical protein BLA18109_03147 [Burkholderia lata]
MTRDELYDQAIGNMERTVHDLAARLSRPEMVTVGDIAIGFRFSEKGAAEAIVQKMARVVSSLRAARLLLAHGFIGEQAAMHRMIDEAEEDISFLSLGMMFGEKDLHRKFLEDFYQEEFEDPARPVQTRIRRGNIPRGRIHAYLAQSPAAGLDPSTASETMQTIHKAYSGYVHGASPHLMEMYGGEPARFHMAGMRQSPLWRDHADDLWNYIYRGISSFGIAAKAFGAEKLFAEIRAYAHAFEKSEPR